MKRNRLLAVIAIFLIVLSVTLNSAGIMALITLPIAGIWTEHRRKKFAGNISSKQGQIFATLDEVIGRYGDPDDIVVTDATRSQEIDCIIPIYDKLGLMIINGMAIKMQDITDITFNNASTPYTSPEYQVQFVTRLPGLHAIYITVGQDAGWAQEVVMQLHRHQVH